MSRRGAGATALVAAGVLLFGAACLAAAYPWWWTHRQVSVARSLVASAPDAVERPVSSTRARSWCSQAPRTSEVAGVLVIPALGLVAPVVQGLSDAVLNVAVGHDPASPMPGTAGEAILEAHDVSYFSALDRLGPGEAVIWAQGCRRWVFKIVSTTVADAGTLLPTPPSGFGLALVTCWPSNALWWTPDRFVVEATLSSIASATAPPRAPNVTPVKLVVPAPRSLVRPGLGLEDNPVVLGTLRVEGSPATAWRLGPGPLDTARIGLEDYFALRRTVESQDRLWWSKLALAGVPLPTSWSNAGVVNTIVHARGESVDEVDLVSTGETVVLVVRGRDLVAARVSS